MFSLLQSASALILTIVLISFTTTAHPSSQTNLDHHHNPTTHHFESSEQEVSRSEPSSEEEDDWAWYESDEYSEEDECPSDEFWHIRGKRCVPFRCPRPNWMRDSNRDWLRNLKTGECLYDKADGEIKSFGNGGGGRTAFANRGVLKLVKGRYNSRGRAVVSKWQTVNQKRRVHLDDDTANPIRTIGLIG